MFISTSPTDPPCGLRSSQYHTLKDIAEVLGISTATVSLALRNSTQISESTRLRVQSVAQEIGYRPNAMATGLAQFKKKSVIQPIHSAIAWLNFSPAFGNGYNVLEYDRYYPMAETTAEKLGYRLEKFHCQDVDSLPEVKRILRARGITGVLLPSNVKTESLITCLCKHLSVVRLGRGFSESGRHSVAADPVANAVLAFDKVHRKGYRRIGFVTGNLQHKLNSAGYLEAQMTVPKTSRLDPCYFGDIPSENEAKFNTWLQTEKPDAIITDQPEVRRLLQNVGCRVPEDIGIAALTMLDELTDAGIYLNPEEIGRVAVLMLLSLIRGDNCSPSIIQQHICIAGKWVDGVSLPERI